MDIVKNHRFALIKNSDNWELVQGSEDRIVRSDLKLSQEKLHALFHNMSEGFAYHRIILDQTNTPCDYIFLEINESFENLIQLKSKDVIGKNLI